MLVPGVICAKKFKNFADLIETARTESKNSGVVSNPAQSAALLQGRNIV